MANENERFLDQSCEKTDGAADWTDLEVAETATLEGS